MHTISGRISSILLREEYTGRTVATVVPEDYATRKRKSELVHRIEGHFAHPLFEGESIRAVGRWDTDDRGNAYLRIQTMTRIPPSNREGEIVALSSYIDGLSKKAAGELLEKTGGLDQLKEICLKTPERLEELLPGATRKVARSRLRSFQWDRNEIDLDLTKTLHSAGKEEGIGGIRTDQIHRMVRHFGAAALKTVLQTRPYDVVDVPKVGFSTADKIAYFYATKQGRTFDPLDPERLRHGVREIVSAERGNGHVCVPEEHLLRACLKSLRAPDGSKLPKSPETIKRLRDAIGKALEHRQLFKEFDQIYTLGLAKAETDLAMQVAKLMRAGGNADPSDLRKVRKYLAKAEAESGMVLTDEQTAAVEMAISQPVSIITGGPGVGKTLTSSRVIGAIKALGRTFQLLAPTGKAAKRASDVAGEEAHTIHRACQLDLQGDVHSKKFGRTLQRHDYFRVQYLIVDEGSMIDLVLLYELLRRVKPGLTKVIIMGDVDQLPPVGAGQGFRDLLTSGTIPYTRLTKTHRQKGGSPIIDCAYAINRGEVPEPPTDPARANEVRILNPHNSKSYVAGPDVKQNQELEAGIITDWLLYSIRKYTTDMGLNGAKDIQVYAPERKGPCGIVSLNQILRNHFNPLPEGLDTRRGQCIKISGGYIVQPGCKVMQAQNHYRMRYANTAPEEAYEEHRDRLQAKEREAAKRNRKRAKKAAAVAHAAEDVIPVMNGQVGYVTRVDPEAGEMEVKFDDLPYPVLYRHSTEWQKLEPAWCMSIHKSQGSETPYAFIVLHSGMYMINRPLLYTGWTRAKQGVLLIATPEVVQKAVTNLSGTDRFGNLGPRLREHLPLLKAA